MKPERCLYHCSECARHFGSLAAFDKHRRGKPNERYCVCPLDLKSKTTGKCLFVRAEEYGICNRRSAGKPSVNVTVWYLR